MVKLQFQVLYRQFLFRIVAPELLSGHAQGDVNTLLGQFAALLIVVSIAFCIPLGVTSDKLPQLVRLIGTLAMEHLLISTTMLVVGLFAVLSWDSTFLDRLDVLVLAPLPVRAATLFLAKAAASATGLSLTVAVLNSISGFMWPFAIAHAHSGVTGALRSFAAWWITMFAAGAFIYCAVLCLQGLTAQLLPRRWFLRVSSFLQIGAFCLFVTVYFLQPPFAGLSELVDPSNQRLLAWLPSYWFLGALQQLNGSSLPVLDPLARRAWIGLAVVIGGAAVVFALSWFRTLRRIVEEPDITPGARGIPLPRFGNAWQTAIVQFNIRGLLRSRQHRLILAFYLGVAFALVIFFMKSPEAQKQIVSAGSRVNAPMLSSTIVMMGFWIVGIRVLFSRPLDLRANWVFRIAPVRGGKECLAANRRSLFVLGLAPLLIGAAILLFSIWPWQPTVAHLIILGLFGLMLMDLCLYDFQKVPFTCSWLPGRSNIHVTFIACVFLILEVTDFAAQLELPALGDVTRYAWTLGVVALAAILARWRTETARWEDGALEFEEVPPWALISLGLPRDGGQAG
jgi:hypothetical protein